MCCLPLRHIALHEGVGVFNAFAELEDVEHGTGGLERDEFWGGGVAEVYLKLGVVCGGEPQDSHVPLLGADAFGEKEEEGVKRKLPCLICTFLVPCFLSGFVIY